MYKVRVLPWGTLREWELYTTMRYLERTYIHHGESCSCEMSTGETNHGLTCHVFSVCVVPCHVFQYVLFQTYVETNFTNIIFLTHIAFGDIAALKQGKMTRLKKQNDSSIYLGQVYMPQGNPIENIDLHLVLWDTSTTRKAGAKGRQWHHDEKRSCRSNDRRGRLDGAVGELYGCERWQEHPEHGAAANWRGPKDCPWPAVAG